MTSYQCALIMLLLYQYKMMHSSLVTSELYMELYVQSCLAVSYDHT